MITANHPETDGQTERVNQSIECYLRCFISAHPHRWVQWISLFEFWYNTNWHSSLGKSPFEVIYGRQPQYFGITASTQIVSADIQEWLDNRAVILASVRQHLHRMHQRMKFQADKHRTERVLAVGDMVFLRLQPYIQQTVVRRMNHKLSFKYFGPFQILERVGEVAYKLELPASSRVHLVFHVSQLRPCLGSKQQVSPQLPQTDAYFQVPVRVLQRHVKQRGLKTVAQGLVQWSGVGEEAATWKDMEALHQQFQMHLLGGKQVLKEGGLAASLLHLSVMILTKRPTRLASLWAGRRGTRGGLPGLPVTTGPRDAHASDSDGECIKRGTFYCQTWLVTNRTGRQCRMTMS